MSAIWVGLASLILAACGAARRDPSPSLTPAPPTPTTVPASATPATVEYVYADLAFLFAYDPEAPLDIREGPVRDENGFQLHDISYASPGGSRVTAWLVVPDGDGPFAGVIYLHWGEGDRDEFLEEASQLAELGAVCILLDAPFRRPGYTELLPDEMYIQTVVEIRRAVDLLASRPDVDTQRLGYVGHSYGATIGGVVAGVETRIGAYVLMAGHPRVSEAFPQAPRSDPRLDAIHYVGQASPSRLFFQFAERDEYISQETAILFYEAGSEPKAIEWYDATHSLNEQARLDRIQWLTGELGLGPAGQSQ